MCHIQNKNVVTQLYHIFAFDKLPDDADGFVVRFTSDGSVTRPGFGMYYQPGSSGKVSAQLYQGIQKCMQMMHGDGTGGKSKVPIFIHEYLVILILTVLHFNLDFILTNCFSPLEHPLL